MFKNCDLRWHLKVAVQPVDGRNLGRAGMQSPHFLWDSNSDSRNRKFRTPDSDSDSDSGPKKLGL